MRFGVLVGLLGLVSVAGCGLGDGTGSLSGALYLRGCTHTGDYGQLAAPATYDMHPTYFVADPVNALASSEPFHPVNKVSLRVQPSGNRADESDLLFINVGDDAQVAATLGQVLEIGPTSNVRVSLTLNDTCPAAEVEPELDGTMTWQAFGSADATNGIQFGDHLAATFSFTVVDRRAIAIGGLGGVPTAPAAGGAIAGSFDFIVRQGKAAQAH
ncbi:MAG: hypothetical protein ACXVDD_04260 [Polyangia bacterium]